MVEFHDGFGVSLLVFFDVCIHAFHDVVMVAMLLVLYVERVFVVGGHFFFFSFSRVESHDCKDV